MLRDYLRLSHISNFSSNFLIVKKNFHIFSEQGDTGYPGLPGLQGRRGMDVSKRTRKATLSQKNK